MPCTNFSRSCVLISFLSSRILSSGSIETTCTRLMSSPNHRQFMGDLRYCHIISTLSFKDICKVSPESGKSTAKVGSTVALYQKYGIYKSSQREKGRQKMGKRGYMYNNCTILAFHFLPRKSSRTQRKFAARFSALVLAYFWFLRFAKQKFRQIFCSVSPSLVAPT